MASYDKFTVVQLRAELKARGLAQTGLTRKQQLIGRLLEHDAGAESNEAGAANIEPEQEDAPEVEQKKPEDPSAQDKSLESVTDPAPVEAVSHPSAPSPEPEGVSMSPGGEVDESPHSVGAGVDANEASKEPETQVESISTPTEDAKSAEKPPNEAPGTSDAMLVQSTATSPAPEEIKKRKRRSATPPPSMEEVAKKKLKTDSNSPAPNVHLKEDLVPVVDEAQVAGDVNMETDTGSQLQAAGLKPESPTGDRKSQDEADSELVDQNESVDRDEDDHRPKIPPKEIVDGHDVGESHEPAKKSTEQPSRRRENLYKDLVPSPGAHRTLKDPTASDEPKDNEHVSPSLHPATKALYIRDLMRPLQPNQLKQHIITLARPPQESQDAETDAESPLRNFYLDGIRTHCFAHFTSVSAASRVRNAMHGRVWPAERMRKPLWADYIPEDKIEQWIQVEEEGADGRRGSATRRWEVSYEVHDDGSVSVELQEGGTAADARRRSTVTATATNQEVPLRHPVPEVRREASKVKDGASAEPASFLALDKLFKWTTAKPKLYYLPVPQERVDKRLDELDSKFSRTNAPRGGGYNDSRRYTFEDADMLVDNGPEFGLRSERAARGVPYGLPPRGNGRRGR